MPLSYSLTQLSYQAFRRLGILRAGQSNTELLNDVLAEAQQLVDGWNIDWSRIYATNISLYTLTAGVQFYAIGPAAVPITIEGQPCAALVAPRPNAVMQANILLNTTSPPVRQLIQIIGNQRWSEIQVQQIPNAIPLELYYDHNFDQTTGASIIRLWPGPLSNYGLELFTPQQITQFPDLTTQIAFPSGYADAISWSLGERLGPSMLALYYKGSQEQADALYAKTVRMAAQARSIIEINNEQAIEHVLTVDAAYSNSKRGSFNYLTGGFGDHL